MRKIGLFLDLSNLYFCVGKRYKGRKVNFKAYIDFVKDLGSIEAAYAYGTYRADEADRFFDKLRDIGFYVRTKPVKEYVEADRGRSRFKADWDVGIVIDIVNMSERINTVVLGSADGDLEPVVDWCVNKGIQVIVLASDISSDLRAKAGECIEIPGSLLESERVMKPTIYLGNKNEASKAAGSDVSDNLSSDGAQPSS